MAKATIVKAPDAAPGEVSVNVGSISYTVDDEKSYETTDPAVIRSAESNPYLQVTDYEGDDEGHTLEELTELHAQLLAERNAVKVYNAEKDPLDPPAIMPESVDDVGSVAAAEEAAQERKDAIEVEDDDKPEPVIEQEAEPEVPVKVELEPEERRELSEKKPEAPTVFDTRSTRIR